jgi:phage terminase large subunit GpA-like protein
VPLDDTLAVAEVPLPAWLTAGEDDPLQALAAAFYAGHQPDPDLTVSEWADEHRVLSGRAAAEPGRYRTDRTPYLREIMDRLSPRDPTQRISFIKGAQVGGSESGNNWMGFCIHHAPGPMMAVQPSVEVAKRFSKQRVDPLIEASAELRERVKPARARDSGNTVLQKDFPGGTLILTGANSAVGLRSMPARYLFLDEVDAYPGDVDGEGDPIVLAEARTSTFGYRRKILLVSTPLVKGRSRIEREYEASDQRRFFVPCPHCGHMQSLEFKRLKWDPGHPETARYECEADGCDKPITDAHKTAMLAGGEWRATAVSKDPLAVGYHLSSLYSPVGWKSWADIARQWDKAQQEGPDALRSFVNTVLGETWAEADTAPEWERLYERRETDWVMGTVPWRCLLLTSGTDVQQDRIEVSIWGWGPGLERWLVDQRVIRKSPHTEEAWDEWAQHLDHEYPHADGGSLQVARAAVDSGDMTQEVYAALLRLNDPRIMATKGTEGEAGGSLVSGPTYVDVKRRNGRLIRRGMKVWTVATSKLKRELYSRLGMTVRETGELPPGWVHFPAGVQPERLKQLVSEERRRIKSKGGRIRFAWDANGRRNEELDCAVYARAAIYDLGVDRYGERFWLQYARSVPVGPEDAPAESAIQVTRTATGRLVMPRARSGRRMTRSSAMG